jgi:hypothetical protein
MHPSAPRAIAAIVSFAVMAGCSSPAPNITSPSAVTDVTTAALHTTPACDHDTVAPTISNASASPNTLWSPNHKMWTIRVNYAVSDNCTPVNAIRRWLTVASDEPVNGRGDGNTSPDWIVMTANTVQLRAERAGPRNGRVYTITIHAEDAAGNESTRNVTVTVAHDQRKK